MSSSTPPALSRRTKLLFAAITAVLALALLELVSWVALRALSPRLEEPVQRTQQIFADQSARIQDWLQADSTKLFVVFDERRGWRQRPGYRSELYTVGPQGVRGTRPYSPLPAPGVLRVDAFGDSFVFGTEMPDSSAWAAVLEREFPNIEVPNYGVGGYGIDQVLLDFSAQGRDLHPQVILVGFVPDQLRRTVNVYRRFLSTQEPPLVKPRFLLGASGGLTLLPTPFHGMGDYQRVLQHPRDVLALGKADAWYSALIYRNPLYDYSSTVRLLTTFWIRASRRYLGAERLYIDGRANPRSEAFRIQVELFAQVVDSIRAQGAMPLLVFFPDRATLYRIADGLAPSYQPLVDTLRARGFDPLDAGEAFEGTKAADVPALFATAHYSAAGNRVVGRWLGTRLEALAGALGGGDSTPSPPAPRSP